MASVGRGSTCSSSRASGGTSARGPSVPRRCGLPSAGRKPWLADR
jgi:hypothetical protein